MAIILPQFIDPIGAGLTKGLETGGQQLSKLLSQKQQEKQQQKQRTSGLSALGFTPQQAKELSGLPENIQQEVIKSFLQVGESAGLDETLNSMLGLGQQGLSGLQALSQFDEPVLGEDRSATTVGSSALLEESVPSKTVQALSKAPQNVPPTSEQVSPQIESVAEAKNDLRSILQRPRLNAQQRIKLAELEQRRKQFETKDQRDAQREVDKETLAPFNKINTEYRAAEANDLRLSRMQELLQRGNLSSPMTAALLNTLKKGVFGFGIDLSAIQTADAQEFDKLTSDFLKDVKAIFGSRITQFEVEAFLKTVPTLVQSDAGKQRVINNLTAFNQASKSRKEGMDKLIEANNGRRPANIESKIDKLIKPELDIIANKFREGFGKETEERSLIKKILSGELLK